MSPCEGAGGEVRGVKFAAKSVNSGSKDTPLPKGEGSGVRFARPEAGGEVRGVKFAAKSVNSGSRDTPLPKGEGSGVRFARKSSSLAGSCVRCA